MSVINSHYAYSMTRQEAYKLKVKREKQRLEEIQKEIKTTDEGMHNVSDEIHKLDSEALSALYYYARLHDDDSVVRVGKYYITVAEIRKFFSSRSKHDDK